MCTEPTDTLTPAPSPGFSTSDDVRIECPTPTALVVPGVAATAAYESADGLATGSLVVAYDASIYGGVGGFVLTSPSPDTASLDPGVYYWTAHVSDSTGQWFAVGAGHFHITQAIGVR